MGSTGRIRVAMEALLEMVSSDGLDPETRATLQFCNTLVDEEGGGGGALLLLLMSSLDLGMQQCVAFS